MSVLQVIQCTLMPLKKLLTQSSVFEHETNEKPFLNPINLETLCGESG